MASTADICRAAVDLGVLPTSWHVQGTGDFNGDGTSGWHVQNHNFDLI